MFQFSLKFPRPGWDQRLVDFNRFSSVKTQSCYSCLVLYFHDHTQFLSAPGLAWQAALKTTKVKSFKLDYITGTNMLLMIEKCIRGEICHSIYRYAKASNNYMK